MSDIKKLQQRYQDISQQLNLEQQEKEIAAIEKESQSADFWKDPVQSGEKMKQLAFMKKQIEQIETVELYLAELESVSEQDEVIAEVEKQLDQLDKQLFFRHQYDANDVILSIHPGQGGTEAMDWAEMLMRMYLRFFEKRGWQVEILNKSAGEEAGIKEGVIRVHGDFVYGHLKFETGTHRLVRLSPFNADNLRQTSFALVEVIPVIAHAETMPINEQDLEFEAIRSGGPGGQNVNKVATTVRITHRPTDITVKVSSERSQHRNREIALEMLKGKLALLEVEKIEAEKRSARGEYQIPTWGSQIRSYTLHPYQLVKDHRTSIEVGDAWAVLDGGLDEFIEGNLRQLS